MLLFYVRHGYPIYNPDMLTDLGKRQAEAVGKKLARYGIDEIYSSSSQRALETAQPLSEIIRKDVTPLDWCHEKNMSPFYRPDESGNKFWIFGQDSMRRKMNSNEIRELGDKWYKNSIFPSEAESLVKNTNKHIDDFFAEEGYIHDRESHTYNAVNPNSKRIAIFAHQAFGLYFLSSVLDIPYPIFSTHFNMSLTGVSVIHFDEKEGIITPTLLQLSSDAHLNIENLPTDYNGNGNIRL